MGNMLLTHQLLECGTISTHGIQGYVSSLFYIYCLLWKKPTWGRKMYYSLGASRYGTSGMVIYAAYSTANGDFHSSTFLSPVFPHIQRHGLWLPFPDPDDQHCAL